MRRAIVSVALVAASAGGGFWVLDAREASVAPPPGEPEGHVLILPGVYNTRFQLAGFVSALRSQLPGSTIDVQRWGTPLLPLKNLRAHEENRATAAELARELARIRRADPDRQIYVVGYSAGGGMAALTVAALPDEITIERLVLVAPAISPEYPLADRVLPHVDELVANYASTEDWQVGWGTRTFGTIDRVLTESAGSKGFAFTAPKLVQWQWSPAARELGHGGNHVAYLEERWQRAALLPALDPALDAKALRAHWDALAAQSESRVAER